MTNQLECVVNIAKLRQIEMTTQGILEREPEDTATRLRLAMCLLGRAFHRAGESMVSGGEQTPADGADQLLQRCLHHATIVTQVSARAPERQQAAALRALIEMAGGYLPLQKSREEEEIILHDLLRSLKSV